MKISIVGAGWAGLTAAVAATEAGHHATVFEAAHAIGGRARALKGLLPDGTPVLLDNGQHILIGAYTETLRLMRQVGVDPQATLARLPLTLQFPDGSGLALPAWPGPLDALAGILTARGWTWGDRWSLIKTAARWQRAGFTCAPQASVAELCRALTPQVMATLVDPLCISALNTPSERASGQVFLRVLHDALLGGQGSSNLLLPTTDLTQLFPQTAAQWLLARGGVVHTGTPARSLGWNDGGWLVNGDPYDAVIWATSASNAAAAITQHAQTAPDSIADPMRRWAGEAQALQFEAIATVYAYAAGLRLPQPMLALPSDLEHPAQFVFDRGQLGGRSGLLAFVVSASHCERDLLQTLVLAQAHEQLARHLQGRSLTSLQTVVEKRATFACTPDLQRPPQAIAPHLFACGDYTKGPYPATLEGAVRSGVAAAQALNP